MAFPDTQLQDRAVLRLAGEDTATFLQGLITNDIAKASDSTAILALILTPQGKFLHDAYIHQHGDSYLLDVDAARVDELVTLLKRYRLRSKVAIEPTQLHVVASEKQGDVPDPRRAEMGYRTYAAQTDLPSDRSDYDAHRIALGVVDPALDMISGASFPLQHRMEEMGAIDYEKGCYVGQEVTARTHYRGTIRKQLYVVTADTALPPGADVTTDGKKIGEIRSTAGTSGMALLDVTTADTGAPMEVDGIMLTVKRSY